ncbi:MAG: hypothetical protein HQK87_09485 [Nitrospinae bacterium]|nr:hypothetical protein [Nitrospinota bacterium]
MLNAITDVFKMGVGAAALSKENFERLARSLAEMGKLSREEGERIVADMAASREQVHAELAARIEAAVKTTIDKMGLATADQVADLKAKIAELEERLKHRH